MSKKNSSKADVNNPNNDAYWQSKGHERRPSSWKQQLAEVGVTESRKTTRLQNDGRGGVDSMFDPLCKEDY